jgi:vacuolar-type H+-ATPase subunit I/STV1
MAEQGEKHRYGLLQSAMEELLERTRAVANLVGSVGSEALGAMPEPVPATVTRLLKSLQQLIEQAPPFTAEFDVLVEEIRAQRLTVQALQAELSAFDHQLDVLEKSLAPLESWAHQWAQLRQSVGEAIHPAAPEPGPPTD